MIPDGIYCFNIVASCVMAIYLLRSHLQFNTDLIISVRTMNGRS